MHTKKSYFHYKSLIKASRLLIFGTYILFDILSNCALKISVSKLISYVFYCFMNFLCISLYFQPFVEGGLLQPPPPPSDLGRGSRDRRKNLHKSRVRCKLQDCIVRLFFIIIFYFI